MAQEAVSEQLPLHGIVLCCTALSQDVRTKLADTVTQMGALFKLDLTCDVTHLIASDITTPKYRYVAKERPDIKVLDLSWVEAVRQQWMTGDDVNVHDLESQHRLPTFSGLKVCITGFAEAEQRDYIADTVKQHGAEYHADLTKSVTHLIAAVPEGAKYTHAKQWGLAVVSFRWMKNSVFRGMALDELLYNPLVPEAEQGKGAFRTEPLRRGASLVIGKRAREGGEVVEEVGKRKLRRTASTRGQSQSQDLWLGMSAQENAVEVSDTMNAWREDAVDTTTTATTTTTPSDQSMQAPPSRPKVQVRRSEIFQQQQHSTTPPPDESLPNAARPNPEAKAEEVGSLLFTGRYILIHAFPRSKVARLLPHLLSNGAHIVLTPRELEKASENLDFTSRLLLVPHALPTDDSTMMDLPEVAPGTEQVTEWWLERCIHSKRYFEPAGDVLSRPLWHAQQQNLPPTSSLFEGLKITTTGFQGVEYRQTAEALRLLGAVYEERLVPGCEVLVCAGTAAAGTGMERDGAQNKSMVKGCYAQKHGIPVVRVEWLWRCIELGRRVGFEGFEVVLPAHDAKALMAEPGTSSPAPMSDVLGMKSSAVSVVGRQAGGGAGVDRVREQQSSSGASSSKRLSNTRLKRATPALAMQVARSAPAPAPVKPVTVPRKIAGPFEEEEEEEEAEGENGGGGEETAANEKEDAASHPATRTADAMVLEDEGYHDKDLSSTTTMDNILIPAPPCPPQVLQELSPNKSPRKTSEQTEDLPLPPTKTDLPPEPEKPAPPPPVLARPQEELTTALASLLKAQRSSRASQSPDPSTGPPTKRKNRPLGRSASGIGQRCYSGSSNPADTGEKHPSSADGDSVSSFSRDGGGGVVPASTQLGYATADAEAHLGVMEKRMRVKLGDDGVERRVVERVGTVKDGGVGDGGVGERVRGRGRR